MATAPYHLRIVKNFTKLIVERVGWVQFQNPTNFSRYNPLHIQYLDRAVNRAGRTQGSWTNTCGFKTSPYFNP